MMDENVRSGSADLAHGVLTPSSFVRIDEPIGALHLYYRPEVKSMVVENSYDELEVSRRASREVIDAAYRRLARKHHPDSGEEPDPARMVRINLAYQAIVSGREPTAGATGRPSLTDLLLRAREAADAGDWSTVDARADEILVEAAEHTDALLFKAEAAIEQERWADAARLTRRVLRATPDHIEALLFAAESAFGGGEYLLARGFAATVLQLAPKDAHAFNMWDDAQRYLIKGTGPG